jgi:hypothetical protein
VSWKNQRSLIRNNGTYSTILLVIWSPVRRRLIAYCFKVLRYPLIWHNFHSTEMFFRVHLPLVLGQGSLVYALRATRRALNSITVNNTKIALNGLQTPVSASWDPVSRTAA